LKNIYITADWTSSRRRVYNSLRGKLSTRKNNGETDLYISYAKEVPTIPQKNLNYAKSAAHNNNTFVNSNNNFSNFKCNHIIDGLFQNVRGMRTKLDFEMLKCTYHS